PGGRGQELPASAAGFWILVQGQAAREDALHVTVHHRHGDAEGDARHRRRRVGADAGEGEETFESGGEGPQLRDPPGRCVELPGSPVIAETGPQGQDLLDPGGGQVLDGGEPLQETIVEREDRFYT